MRPVTPPAYAHPAEAFENEVEDPYLLFPPPPSPAGSVGDDDNINMRRADGILVQRTISITIEEEEEPLGPGAAEAHTSLPPGLLNSIPNRVVLDCLHSPAYEDISEIRRPENVLSVFFTEYLKLQPREHDAPIRSWMASDEGKARYKQIKATLFETSEADQMARCLVVLVCYGQILGNGEDQEPPRGGYLCDYFCHLDGAELESRATWQYMACAFRRVAIRHDSGRLSCSGLASLVAVVQKPFCLADYLLDGYWQYRLAMPHEDSRARMAKEVSDLCVGSEALKLYLVKS